MNEEAEGAERPSPIDAADRLRLQIDLDSTFFVEAGAGTGKTTALVARIVAMVAAGRAELDRLAAITFTVAAAAELRSRIRQQLESAGNNPELDQVERTRCASAAGQVDLATIQTIHAFAGTLLRTFPIEARLPPGFQTLDAFQSDLVFDERFRAWLWDEIPSEFPEARSRREAMRRALLLGMTFDQLRQLAREFEEQADLLDAQTSWPTPAPPDPVAVAHALSSEILGLGALFGHAELGEDDPMIAEYRRHELAVRRLATVRDEIDALGALMSVGAFKTPGNQNHWSKIGTGENTLKLVKAGIKAADTELKETLEAHRQSALAAVLGFVRDFTLASAAARRSAGTATFHDLLTWARDLLRDQLEVRQRARQRFSRIFVDEFQDTDPLQAEIVWFLASDEATSRAEVWTDVALEPGKLFVVGDPKQSIYRFRRADIGLYSRIYGTAPENIRGTLRENFRSVSAVIDWVNYQFALDMTGATGVQAPYIRLHVPPDQHGQGGVHYVGGQVDGGAGGARQQEAGAIALMAQQAVAGDWKVRDIESSRPPLGEWRAVAYRDICILLRTRANVRELEDAFERRNIPYRMDGGSFVLETQEVSDLLSCLRSIDDPSDQIALVAALRSPAYACSDVDLLDWVEAGGKLDYLHASNDLAGPVANAFRSLKCFHAARVDRSVAMSVEEFIRDRMLAIGAFAGRRPRATWRRFRYVVAQARSLAAAGRPTLRSLVDWLENQQRARVRDVESPTPEADEDAVRVMTIHGAKGLEFPVTVLTGLGATRGGRPSSVVVYSDRETKALEVKVGAFQTAGFNDAKTREDQLEAAEQVRLLYVAATRARDHLVLSLYHGATGANSAAARYLRGFASTSVPGWSELSLDELPGLARPDVAESPVDLDTPEDHEVAESQWSTRRAAAIARVRSSPIVAATDLAKARNGSGDRSFADDLATEIDDEAEPVLADLDPAAPPVITFASAASRIGQAVHAALAAIGPGGDVAIEVAVDRAAKENRVGGQVERVTQLVASALASHSVVAARAARHWREVPLGIAVSGRILAAKIDLLVERPDGSLQIVDYKTSQADPLTLKAHARQFRVQGGAYALLIEAIAGKNVSAVTIIYAALGGREVELGPVDELIAEARSRLDTL